MWYRKLIASNNEGVYQAELPNLKLPSSLMNILKDLDQKGKKGLVVGGAVRDALLGLDPKDIDVEVYGVNLEALAHELNKYGYTNLVGAAFGVIKFSEPINFKSPEVVKTMQKVFQGTPYEGMDLDNPNLQKNIRELIKKAKSLNPNSKDYKASLQDPVLKSILNNMKSIEDVTPEYDFSVPRRDNKVGTKHTDFQVEVDPNMSPKEAAGRRDITINALAFNPLNNQIHDYYNGVEDLNNGVLKATTSAFSEDLLRVWRLLQFSTRLKTPDGKSFTIDPATAEMSRDMIAEYVNHAKENPNDNSMLPKERIVEEFNKAMLKGKDYSHFFNNMHLLGIDTVFPELGAQRGVEQEKDWHPEIWLHDHVQYGMMHMKEIINRENNERKYKGLPPMSEDDQLVRMYGILLHDVAKPVTTKREIKNGVERITSPGHEPAGGPIARKVLEQMGVKKSIIDKIQPIIEQHLAHITYPNVNDKIAWLRKLGRKLGSADYESLFHIFEADHSSRPPLPKGLHPAAEKMREHVKQLGYYNELPKSPIKGQHVQPYYQGHPLGTQGKHIGEAVQAADAAWLNNQFTDEEGGKAWLHNYLRPSLSAVKKQDIAPYFQGRGMGDHITNAWNAQHAAVSQNQPFNKQQWMKENIPNYVEPKVELLEPDVL